MSLKEKQYLEYKYRKQEYLLKVDYESVTNLKKESIIEKYNKFYTAKMDTLYKGLLKNYSIQLADTVSSKVDSIDNTYNKIFSTLETYISDILPIKLRTNNKENYKNIIEDYEKYESMLVGKLDERDRIRQKMVLLGISRELFTHSLPLIAAEQCYEKLINDVRKIIVNSKTKARRDTTFELLIELIEDYNIRLLSTSKQGEEIIRQFVEQGINDHRCEIIMVVAPQYIDNSFKGTLRLLAKISNKKVVFVELKQICKLLKKGEIK